MSDKYFPIKTETACQLKWTWSTIQLYDGATNSCHRVGQTIVNLDNFDQFHNTEKKINDRKLMLDGKWPKGGCEYCSNIEQAGGQSDRQFQLQIPGLTPPELETDPTAVEVTPRILEIYFDNVCNMSCIYCWNGFSSRIEQENIKFGDFVSNGIEIKNTGKRHPEFNQLVETFWSWMENHAHKLRRFHVLGGEPLYQKQFETCLEFLETHNNPELEFNIVSNLKVTPAKLENIIDRIQQLLIDRRIKRFDLTCSIDCWDDEQEYIRYGIDMEQWRQNFDYVASKKWITLNINQTITCLGIKSIPQLIEYINHHRKSRPIGHYFMACVNRSQLYPGIFGSGFFDKDFERILSVMPDDVWQHKNARDMMQGLQLEFNSHQRDPVELLKLKTFLTELDRRRNLSWQKTFPWLVKELENVV
jgi:pyruvate-formate lyase-activating enzyme